MGQHLPFSLVAFSAQTRGNWASTPGKSIHSDSSRMGDNRRNKDSFILTSLWWTKPGVGVGNVGVVVGRWWWEVVGG